MTNHNEFGQPIGDAIGKWAPRQMPPLTPMVGNYCSVERLDAERHAADLYAALSETGDGRDWTYSPAGPFSNLAQFADYLRKEEVKSDPMHHVIIDRASGKPLGLAALMRIDPINGVIEVGHIVYSQRLKRSRSGTEAMYLFMRRAFDELGYRRYEWKCDSLNAPSRSAAERYGFRFEGIFRQAIVYKGRTRDTAWFSITDTEWPALRLAFERWLAAENFRPDGSQIRTLAAFRGPGT